MGASEMMKSLVALTGFILLFSPVARADVTLLVEEPYGAFGGMTPTGHAAVYFSRVCADTPVTLRRCLPGETGVVISRYHRIDRYDWVAIPLIAYMYAVDRPDEVPGTISPEQVAAFQDRYRRAHLEGIVPDEPDGSTPKGDWIQLVGEGYYRTMYAFRMETSETKDDQLIREFNRQPNRNRFSLLLRNCADFSRQTINFYFPHAIHRSLISDIGIMTPKEAAESLVRYGNKHSELDLTSFIVPQIPGTMPRSHPVRGVLESFVKSKRYLVPLAPLAILHPGFGAGLVYAYFEGSHFQPGRMADHNAPLTPEDVASNLDVDTRSAIAQARAGDAAVR
jgi:hypothetical protein